MNYSGSSIECVRFGARLGRESIGCCGLDLFQAFDNSPMESAVFPLRYGDEDTPIYGDEGGVWALQGTNEELFWALLQSGTFCRDTYAARSFLAVLTECQIEEGTPWLRILAEAGFEFIRAFDNGIYASDHGPLYLFGYFRDYGGGETDPREPPAGWADLVAEARRKGRGYPVFEPERHANMLTTIPEGDA